MQIIIDEVVSTVHAVDSRSALGPETMRSILDAVLAALRQRDGHDQRVENERSTDNGYFDRIEKEGR